MKGNKDKSPRVGRWILKKILPSEERRYFIEGIEERYVRELADKGRISALFWYFKGYDLRVALSPKPEKQAAWRAAHERTAASIERAELLVAEESAHMIPMAQPEIIIDAVTDTLSLITTGR